MFVVRGLQKLSVSLSRLGVAAAVLILVACTGLILAEIILRTFFARSTFVTTELVAYGMAAMSFMALGETLDRGGLIRLTMIFEYLSPKQRQPVEVVLCIITLAAMFVPVWYFGRSVVVNYERGFTSGTILDLPVWIPEFGMWVGLAIFWLRLLSYALLVGAGIEKIDLEKASKMMSEIE